MWLLRRLRFRLLPWFPLPALPTVLKGSRPSEQWAVLDNGRTLSPYSEAFEGKVTRRWAERIAGTKTVGFQLDGKARESLGQPTFETGELAEALSSVGCSY